MRFFQTEVDIKSTDLIKLKLYIHVYKLVIQTEINYLK